MTNLIIHTDVALRRKYLLSQVNFLLEKEYAQISQLHNDPDIHIIEQPEQVSIKLEDVKQLMKDMQFKPFQSKYQIGLIFHASNMTMEAQNAILKTLEEQGEESVYFLLTSNERALLPTIVSRSIKHYVKRDRDEIVEKEVEEKPDIISMDLLEQFNYIEKIVEQEKEEKGVVAQNLTRILKFYSSEMSSAIDSGDMDRTKTYKDKINFVEEAITQLNANVNKRLLLENLILKLND